MSSHILGSIDEGLRSIVENSGKYHKEIWGVIFVKCNQRQLLLLLIANRKYRLKYDFKC